MTDTVILAEVMQPLWSLGAAIVGGVGTGVILYRALKDKLIDDLTGIFARQSKVDALQERHLALEHRTEAIDVRASDNRDSVIQLREQWRPWVKIMERIDVRLDEHEKLHARTAAILDQIEKRLDRQDDRMERKE